MNIYFLKIPHIPLLLPYLLLKLASVPKNLCRLYQQFELPIEMLCALSANLNMHETEPKHPRAILWNAIFSDNKLSARN